MNSLARFLWAKAPDAFKQAVLRTRLRSRGRRIVFGRGARIDSNVEFAGQASLNTGAAVYGSKVGRWTYFGDHSLTIFSDIGAFCSIAPHVIIGGGKHPTRDFVTTCPLFYSALRNPWGSFPSSIECRDELPRTHIGNDVWIGYSAVVLPGVRVGDGAIIGAGSVVTRDVEPYAIVTGVPAKILRLRFDREDVNWLRAHQWWNWPDERLKRLRPQFSSVACLRAAVETALEPVAVVAIP